jgi:serine/threonine protein kinase
LQPQQNCPRESEIIQIALKSDQDLSAFEKSHLAKCAKCAKTVSDRRITISRLNRHLSQLTQTDIENAEQSLSADRSLAHTIRDSTGIEARELARETALFSTPCRFGQYDLHELISPGGMGEVYRAEHSRLKRNVAIKVIRAGQQNNPSFYERFLSEIETLGRLEHPNVVRAYDAIEIDGLLFLVMEFIPGDSLDALAKKAIQLSCEELVNTLRSICSALSALHKHGYLHLDVKPSNIMRQPDNTIKLIDYGLSIKEEAASVLPPRRYGTPGYIAPEVVSQGVATIRSDIYSAGRVLEYLIDNLANNEDATKAVDTHKKLRELAKRMTSVHPADRPANMEEMIAHVDQEFLADLDKANHKRRINFGRAKTGLGFLLLISLVVSGILYFAKLDGGNSSSKTRSVPAGTTVVADITNSIGMQLNMIPEGRFTHRPEASIAGDIVEFPTSTIEVSPFYLGVFEVTQSQYEKVMEVNPSLRQENITSLPVNQVDLESAREFCRRLSELPAEKEVGRVYRLPTATEWEYACRAGTETAYSFGNSDRRIGFYAWYNGNSGYPKMVGQKQPNAWGLFDMHGNEAEICENDLNQLELSQLSSSITDDYVLKGGAYSTNAISCRSGHINDTHLNGHRRSAGFRVACDLVPMGDERAFMTQEQSARLQTFEIDLHLSNPIIQSPESVTNACIVRESNGSIYWAPEAMGQLAEIVYQLDLPGPIHSVLEFPNLVYVWNTHMYPVFDPLGQGMLEVSRDGETWLLLTETAPNTPIIDRRPHMLPLLIGATRLHVRCRLFSSRKGEQSRYSQFLRCSEDRTVTHKLKFKIRGSGDQTVNAN